MAKLPKVIRDINRRGSRGFRGFRGFVTGGEINDRGRVMGSDGQEYLVSEGYQPGDTLDDVATVYGGTATGTTATGTKDDPLYRKQH